MQNKIFNLSSLNHGTNFKLTLLFLKDFIKNMQMLQNPNPGYYYYY